MMRWPTLSLQLKARLPLLLILITLLLAGCEAKKSDSALQMATQGLISGSLSDASEYAVIGSLQHGGSLWHISDAERKYNWNHRAGEFSSLRAVGISANGKVAVTAVNADLVVWSTDTGQAMNYWRAPDRVMSIAVDPEGHFAILGLQNNLAVYFDIRQGLTVYEFEHEAEVFGVSLSNNGELAMTGSDDRTARVWRLSDGALLHKFEHGNQVKTVALSDDGKLGFSTAQREDAVIWDLQSGNAKATLNFRYQNYTAARFAKDNSTLLVGTFRGLLYLVNTSDGSKLATWSAKPQRLLGPTTSSAILDVAFNGSNKATSLASDGMLQFFSR